MAITKNTKRKINRLINASTRHNLKAFGGKNRNNRNEKNDRKKDSIPS